MKKILHTEASLGWGGQEIRILKEAKGMRERGYEVHLALSKESGLYQAAKKENFIIKEVHFSKKQALKALFSLILYMRKENIDIVNTHSSLDAWLAGIAARICGKKLIRTRHLSTPTRAGLNARLLYKTLADYVVSTCEETAEQIRQMTKRSKEYCKSIPTGIDLPKIKKHSQAEIRAFREKHSLKESDFVVGTVCILRGWKGVQDLLAAAEMLKDLPHLRFIVVGSGVSENWLKEQWRARKLEEKVLFLGYQEDPLLAIAAMDVFSLLSLANEGVSQASLQAAACQRPLLCTRTGGLKEVCIEGKTGLELDCNAPEQIAEKIRYLMKEDEQRSALGKNAQELVNEKFTFEKMLDDMEAIYQKLSA